MTNIANTIKTVKAQNRQFNYAFLQGILEGFTYGILLLTERGEILYANWQLHQILDHLAEDEHEAHLFNQEIWRLHAATTKTSSIQTHYAVILESKLLTTSLGTLHLEARRSQLTLFPTPLVIVTIQNQRLQKRVSLKNVQQDGLTPRELEIWALRQANYSYAEIATELYISINTVKKHLKNIYAKLGCSLQHRMKAS
ncbi:MAG: LuxR C-terminal-related transcriptional regulator [Cyanobacteria bacterium]|nr:LuxR C-terminal-related transcriptional regulator [Cyanobacteriota bacterium]MDW8200103.1 LuxR C-terminal-related transcriptional regulator [Cyanobacteriota bacterium SKYGB_h_bin112]